MARPPHDEWEWKLGRLVEDEELFRFRGTAERRARSALSPGGARHKPPVIVKIASAPRTRAGARAVAAYIARLRPSDSQRKDKVPRLYDEAGLEIARGQVLEYVEAWGLDAEEAETPRARLLYHAARARDWCDELRHAARAADPDVRVLRALLRTAGVQAGHEDAVRRLAAQAAADIETEVSAEDLSREERWRSVLARHFIYSAPIDGNSSLARRTLELAVAKALNDTFGMWGHRCLWGTHYEHNGHVHVHVLVRNRNDLGEALRFKRDALLLDRLRESLAEAAQSFGLDVEATRHADRPELVAALLSGRTLLPDSERELAKRQERWNARYGAPGLITAVANRLPEWFCRHGEAYRHRGETGGAEPPVPFWHRLLARPPRVPPGYDELARLVEPTFGAATATALGRFDEMRREEAANRTLSGTSGPPVAPYSEWLLLRHPALFAAVNTSAQPPARVHVQRVLRALPPPGAPVGEPIAALAERRASLLRRFAQPSEEHQHERRLRDVNKVVRHLEELAHADETLNRNTAAMDRAAALRERANEIAGTPLPDSGLDLHEFTYRQMQRAKVRSNRRQRPRKQNER